MLDWHLQPEVFKIGSTSIRWYGICFAVGFLLAYKVFESIMRGEGRSVAEAQQVLLCMIAGTVIGGRLGHCFFYHPAEFLREPGRILMVWQGGNSSHGALVGIIVVLLIYTRWRSISFVWLSDRLCVAIPLPAAFVRLGNFTNSEILGIPTKSDWGVVFSRVDLIPRHPVVLYEAAANLFVFAVMLYLYYNTKAASAAGRLWGTFFVLLFGFRFLLEYFKDSEIVVHTPLYLTMGQLLSVPCVAAGMILIARSYWADSLSQHSRTSQVFRLRFTKRPD